MKTSWVNPAWRLALGLLLAVVNLSAFAVKSGLEDDQVLQRGPNGTAGANLQGTTERAGNLKIRLRTQQYGLRVPGFANKSLGPVEAGEWQARLDGLPAGGPYRVEIALEDDAGDDIDRHVIERVLVGDLWILAGQSNMVGRAELENVETPDEQVHVLQPKGGWAVAKEPIHERRERNEMVIGAGLGLSFAKEMVHRTGIPIGLIPCAKGGTSLWEWDPELKSKGRESLYGNMLARFEEAGGRVRGMLWYQGEADAREGRVEPYFDRFRAFVASVRKDLRDDALPMYTAQLSRYVIAPGERNDRTWSMLRESQRKAARELQNVGLVSGVDLELVDLIHVDTESLKRLGVRFAKRACQDLFRSKPSCSKLEPGPQYEGVEWDGPFRLRVKISGANGEFTAPGRILGFDVRDREGRCQPLVFRARVSESQPDEVVLSLVRRSEVPDPAFLWHCYGMDAACNLVDAEDLALPAFGPIPLPPRPPLP